MGKLRSGRKYGSRYRPYSKYGRYVKAGLSLASKAYGMYSSYKNNGTSSSGQGVTNQFDRKTVYRKKRMPYRKKRQWKRFVKKVNAALLKEVGTKTIIRNTQVSAAWADDSQQALGVVLFGKDGLTDSSIRAGLDDMRQIFANDPDLSNPTSQAHFFSGVIDFTFTNMSELVGDASNNNTGLEIDLYELVFTKYVDNAGLASMFIQAATNTDAINMLNPAVTINVRGATPFDLPDFLAQGVRILKKTKFFLGKGEVATYQYRDPKNFKMRRDVVDNADENFAIPYKTRGFLFVGKGIPTPDATKVLKSLQIGCTRKYGYKVISKNIDQDNVII